MNFNVHSELEGQHAFLSASKYHWVNYDTEKLNTAFTCFKQKEIGIKMHEFAANAINLGVKLANNKKTLNMYVNDAIGYKMTPEQTLFYSYNAFGTADAISYRQDLLRIHDLKTGVSPASMKQLEVYTSLFCLEYNKVPEEIGIELRIYQNNQVLIHTPDPNAIHAIMDKIIVFDKEISKIKY